MEQILDALRTYRMGDFVGDMIGIICLIVIAVGTMAAGVILVPGAM